MATRHFLLVSGPSGGGKSTFIQHLTDGRLPPEIASELPLNCASWPIIEANNMLKNKVSLAEILKTMGSSESAILHYDIAYIHRFGLTNYASDPASALFTLSDRLDVVLVKPGPDNLQRQYRERHYAHYHSKSLASRLWGTWVRRPVRRAFQRLQGKIALETQALYLSEDWLQHCYSDWHDYIHQLIKNKPASKVLQVVPCQQADGNPGFNLISIEAAHEMNCRKHN
jgi:energy-coupling factor transporter ATP-binding protein EcfA2